MFVVLLSWNLFQWKNPELSKNGFSGGFCPTLSLWNVSSAVSFSQLPLNSYIHVRQHLERQESDIKVISSRWISSLDILLTCISYTADVPWICLFHFFSPVLPAHPSVASAFLGSIPAECVWHYLEFVNIWNTISNEILFVHIKLKYQRNRQTDTVTDTVTDTGIIRWRIYL